MFPIENMPAAVRWLAFVDPLAHFMGLLRNIMLKGGETTYVISHIVYLALIAVVSVVASFRRFHTTLE
jgi:ABC-type multidrug transport system permease subunit